MRESIVIECKKQKSPTIGGGLKGNYSLFPLPRFSHFFHMCSPSPHIIPPIPRPMLPSFPGHFGSVPSANSILHRCTSSILCNHLCELCFSNLSFFSCGETRIIICFNGCFYSREICFIWECIFYSCKCQGCECYGSKCYSCGNDFFVHRKG